MHASIHDELSALHEKERERGRERERERERDIICQIHKIIFNACIHI